MENLKQFLRDFESALSAEDWALVAELQRRLKATVESVSANLQTEADQKTFADLIQQLIVLVERAENLAIAAKEATAKELGQLQQTRSAVALYSSNSPK